MRQVYLDSLPRYKKNRYASGSQIDWANSIGYVVSFVYDDVIGEFKIVECDKSNTKRIKLIIEYNGKEFNIDTGSLYQGKIRKILNKPHFDIKYYFNIGENLYDEKRNITLTDKKIMQRTQINTKCKSGFGNHYIKWYKYTCNICGWTEGWDTEDHLKEGRGCSCCAGRSLVKEINSFGAKFPELIKYLDNPDEAFNFTYGANKSVSCVCPICGYRKKMSPHNLSTYGFFCPNCSDGISMPEKFMISLLNQLNIEYIYQLSSSYFQWCDSYRYDFYLPNYNCIIEVHGEQHYKETNRRWSLKEEQENDIKKEKLAKNNNIENYVVINASSCTRISQDDFINEIKSNSFMKQFDLNSINWDVCAEYTRTSMVEDICKFYDQCKLNDKYISPTDIGKIFKLSTNTINKYLHFGTKHGLCEYDAEESRKRGLRKSRNTKPVDVYKNSILVNSYESMTQLSKLSKEHYGFVFSASRISKICDKDEMFHGYTIRSLEKGV